MKPKQITYTDNDGNIRRETISMAAKYAQSQGSTITADMIRYYLKHQTARGYTTRQCIGLDTMVIMPSGKRSDDNDARLRAKAERNEIIWPLLELSRKRLA